MKATPRFYPSLLDMQSVLVREMRALRYALRLMRQLYKLKLPRIRHLYYPNRFYARSSRL